MIEITEKEIITKIHLENPWWNETGAIDDYYGKMKPRGYLERLYKEVTEKDVQRAVVLMGPRRVGKTVILYHVIQRLIYSRVEAKRICYISIDSPVYIGLGLEKLVELYLKAAEVTTPAGCHIFFDEIQYLKNWEVHLKKLVDDYKAVKFIASGSAAAALKLKSAESGAGRFTDFHLPPLTFYEYLDLLGKEGALVSEVNAGGQAKYAPANITELNKEFINYLNFGGYPEALFSEAIKADPQRYIKSDIIDKVLLRDLPGLYGIHDIQELNRLFTVLAYNTGCEVSLDELSKNSGVAKNTIKKYLEYLEAAFLIKILHRIDQSGRRFRRANFFKVYLTNPSMRCALFGAITADHEFAGNVVETALVNHILELPLPVNSYYARWKDGEVDMVGLYEGKIFACHEFKWSNRFFDNPAELKGLIQFAKKNNVTYAMSTTLDKSGTKTVDGISIAFIASSFQCWSHGKILVLLNEHEQLKRKNGQSI